VHVRLARDRVGALADRRDHCALFDRLAARDRDGAELEERDRVAVGRPDRERAAAARNGADEGNGSAGRRKHGDAHGGAYIEAAMLPARVRILAE
jgi:hypothetical protein